MAAYKEAWPHRNPTPKVKVRYRAVGATGGFAGTRAACGGGAAGPCIVGVAATTKKLRSLIEEDPVL
jgi:hypothetical protein